MIDESSWNFTKLKWIDKYMIGHSGFIAGGCFKQIFTGEKVKDIDIFFTSEKEHAKAVKYFEKQEDDFHKYYDNPKVVAFKDSHTGLTVELIKSVFGTPKKIIGEFDFTITKFTYYKHVNEDDEMSYRCLYHPKFFEHLTMKRTVLDDRIPFPVSTFERMLRYTKYGYYPCRETKKKLLESIKEMPQLEDVTLSLYDGLD